MNDIELDLTTNRAYSRNYHTTEITTPNIAVLKYLNEANPNNLFKAKGIKRLG